MSTIYKHGIGSLKDSPLKIWENHHKNEEFHQKVNHILFEKFASEQSNITLNEDGFIDLKIFYAAYKSEETQSTRVKEYKSFISSMSGQFTKLSSEEKHKGQSLILKTFLLVNAKLNYEKKFVEKISAQLRQSDFSLEEVEILYDLIFFCEDDQIVEILKGAHVQIADQGMLYDKWKQLKHIQERVVTHSHRENSSQCCLTGAIFREVVFGVVEKYEQTMTFFRMEGILRTPAFSIAHCIDSLKCAITGKSTVPSSSSPHTDKNPINIETNPFIKSYWNI